jgi:UPF0716 protein FxsA
MLDGSSDNAAAGETLQQFSRFLFVLFLLFVVLPLVELTLLLILASMTHWTVSLALVIITGLSGSFLLHRQGTKTFYRVRDELVAGRVPADAVLDGMLLITAGALLLTPGVLTDAVGLVLLIPISRQWVKAWLVRWFKAKFAVSVSVGERAATAAAAASGKVVDSYAVDSEEEE